MATRKRYTKEFTQDAVRLVTEQGYNHYEAARNLGIDRGGARPLGEGVSGGFRARRFAATASRQPSEAPPQTDES